MPEQKTKFVVETELRGAEQAARKGVQLNKMLTDSAKAQARGYEEAQKKLLGFSKIVEKTGKMFGRGQLDQSTREFKRELEGLEDQLQGLARAQLNLTKKLQEVDEGTDEYKLLNAELRDTEKSYQRVSNQVRLLGQVYKREAQALDRWRQGQEGARGAFTQGFLQGAVPGAAYLQRGPGVMRQAAGVAAGGALRRGVGGALAMPFTGMAGLTTALGAIPGLGPLAAGQLQMGAGFAGLAMQRQQARMAAAPYMAGFGGFGVGGGRSQASIKQEIDRIALGLFKALPAVGEGSATERITIPGTMVTTGFAPRAGAAAPGAYSMEEARRIAEAQVMERERTRQRARAGVTRGAIRGAGLNLLGVNEAQAMQAAAAITAAGGGTLEDLRGQGMLRAGFAAQTRYGLGADVSGAFLQAGRRGGMLGAQGRGGQAMVDALRDGLQAGLEGSELQDYMRQMAEDIRTWKSTGIPISREAIGDMTRGLSGMGLGAIRGQVVGRGLRQYAGRLAAQGPQTGADVLMMRSMGWRPEMGIEGYEALMERMETGEIFQGPEGTQNLSRAFRAFMGAGGGGATGRAVFRQALRGMGITVGRKEVRALQQQIESGQLTPERAEQFIQAGTTGAGGPQTVGDLVDQARKAVVTLGPNIRRQAELQNQQAETGQRMLRVMQQIEAMTTDMNEGVVRALVPAIQNFVTHVDRAATAMSSIDFGQFMDYLQKLATGGLENPEGNLTIGE